MIRYLVAYPQGRIGKICKIIERNIFTNYAQTIVCSIFFILIITIFISATVYEFVPRVSDEIAQLFQARIFLSGHLTAPSPPLPEFFSYAEDNIIVTPRWYSQYPPAYSFLLMIGLLFGSPWFINPLLAALSALLIFVLCREVFGHETAIIALILFTLSPKVLFTSASLMNHTSAMFFIFLSIVLVVMGLNREEKIFLLFSGISLGISLNIRPLDAVILFIPVFLFCIRAFSRCGYNGLKMLFFWVAGFLIMVAILLIYNYFTTGHPLVFGYFARWGESHYLGFHKIRGGRLHTPLLGLINTILQIRMTDKGLFEWVIPVSFFILILLFFVRKTVWDLIFLSINFCNLVLYFFWGWTDNLFMGRFYFSATPYLIVLVARGLVGFVQLISESPMFGLKIKVNHYLYALLLIGLCIFISYPIRAVDLDLQYNKPELQVDRRLYKLAKEGAIHNAIIFIEPQDKHELIVGSGFFMNTPNLSSQDVIFAKDLGYKNKELLTQYPERKGFLYRHRRDIRKIVNQGYCISPPEAFELVAIDGR
jgi:hypothetical protein